MGINGGPSVVRVGEIGFGKLLPVTPKLIMMFKKLRVSVFSENTLLLLQSF